MDCRSRYGRALATGTEWAGLGLIHHHRHFGYSHFRARIDLPKKKSHLESGLNQRDRARKKIPTHNCHYTWLSNPYVWGVVRLPWAVGCSRGPPCPVSPVPARELAGGAAELAVGWRRRRRQAHVSGRGVAHINHGSRASDTIAPAVLRVPPAIRETHGRSPRPTLGSVARRSRMRPSWSLTNIAVVGASAPPPRPARRSQSSAASRGEVLAPQSVATLVVLSRGGGSRGTCSLLSRSRPWWS